MNIGNAAHSHEIPSKPNDNMKGIKQQSVGCSDFLALAPKCTVKKKKKYFLNNLDYKMPLRLILSKN